MSDSVAATADEMPQSQKHPRGLATLFFTEMWERFSYYGMRALLVLFMVDAVQSGGLGLDDKMATAIYGLYTAGVYLVALPGGWIADRLLGQQKSVWYGGLIIMSGHFVLAIPSTETFFLGLILVVAIVAYDLVHKKLAASVLLMGACRGLVYLVAAAAVAWPLDWKVAGWLSVSLALYTIGITVVARAETRAEPGTRRWTAAGMPVLVLLPAVVVQPGAWSWAIASGIALTGWLALAVRFVFSRPPRTLQAVLTWLSGICLVDAFFLTLLGHPVLALLAAGCFVLTAWGHRHILGS